MSRRRRRHGFWEVWTRIWYDQPEAVAIMACVLTIATTLLSVLNVIDGSFANAVPPAVGAVLAGTLFVAALRRTRRGGTRDEL